MSAETIAVDCGDVEATVLIFVDLDSAGCSLSSECAEAGRDCTFCSSSSRRLPIEKSGKGTHIRAELRRIRKYGGRIGLQTFDGDSQRGTLSEGTKRALEEGAAELSARLENMRRRERER